MPNGLLRACYCRIAGASLAVVAAAALTGCGDSSSDASTATADNGTVTTPTISGTISPSTGNTTSDSASPGTILTAGGSTTSITTSETTPAATTPADGTQEALLTWNPPQENTDGSELEDLAGYRVYSGQDPDHLTDVADLAWSGYMWVRFTDLNPGTWYFSIRSYNSAGVESDFAPPVSKEIA